ASLSNLSASGKRLVMNPLGENELLAARDRRRTVQALGIGFLVPLAGKENAVSGPALVTEGSVGKLEFTTFVAVVEVQEKRGEAIAGIGPVGSVGGLAVEQKIVVRLDFLADGIVEDLRRLHVRHGNARCVGDLD